MNPHPQWTDQAMSNLYAVWGALMIGPGMAVLLSHVMPLTAALCEGLAFAGLIWIMRARG